MLACSVAAFATFGAFIPEYSRAVGMPASGGLFAVYASSASCGRVVGARLPERSAPGAPSRIALGNVSASLLILAAVPGSRGRCGSRRPSFGVGVAFNYPSLMALTVNRVDDRDRAMAVSSFTMFFEVGSAVGGLRSARVAQIVGKQPGSSAASCSARSASWLLRTRVVAAPTRPPSSTRSRPRLHPRRRRLTRTPATGATVDVRFPLVGVAAGPA